MVTLIHLLTTTAQIYHNIIFISGLLAQPRPNVHEVGGQYDPHTHTSLDS